MAGSELQRLVQALVDIAERAGAEILSVYETAFAVRGKDDSSPVTDADVRAEAAILRGLAETAPLIPVVAEESVAAGNLPDISGGRFFLVDPLDGTREFISRNGEFTVNIALIADGLPMLGVVFAPALDRMFAGDVQLGAWLENGTGRHPIRCRSVPEAGLTVVASRSHGDAAALEAFLAGRKVAASARAGSSLKLCLIAAGETDLYPRLGRTMEWDIAAGHAVLAAAGGCVTDLHGEPLRYGKTGFENPHFVAAALR